MAQPRRQSYDLVPGQTWNQPAERQTSLDLPVWRKLMASLIPPNNP